MRLFASFVVTLLTLVPSGECVAQPRASKQLFTREESVANARVSLPRYGPHRLLITLDEARTRSQPTSRTRSRDSLINGALIGAVAGAVALGTLGAVICKVQQEPEGPSCLPDALRIAAVGAAIGAGGGLVIDAALTRQGRVSVSIAVRF